MKRLLLTAGLTLAAVTSFGCSSGDTIKAEVPGGSYAKPGLIESSGQYTLYHVTKLNNWGGPDQYEKITTIDLKAHDSVGFEYVMPKDQQFDPDAKSDVIAYAGTFRRNLGPIRDMSDRYYWADPSSWDAYWAARPGRVLARKAIQY